MSMGSSASYMVHGKAVGGMSFSPGRSSKAPKGCKVAFLGCKVSFWGDIAGNLVRALQRLNEAKCVLCVGKLGSLRSEHSPNQLLATGNTSFLRNQTITWDSPLEDVVNSLPSVVHGIRYSSPSVLDETKDWLIDCTGKYDWVDPEIGHIAKASIDGGTRFGYLHIISDDLACKHVHDLSNERLMGVIHGRKMLIEEIEDALTLSLGRWTGQ